ncbi:unnamed protein product [Plutella xylostella]|uniref:(diamondback moth) hypothetical protein n=1 Tax=Plutella xylostella TaxID=51655 RepID=A0A8S4E0B4_PLUXY|nr:unnamed protein product [Plutella xylostella]
MRLLGGKYVHLEFSGNLLPVTKCGTQPTFKFEAFKDNRVEFTVRVKHQGEPAAGRVYFMNEPKVAKGEQSQTPACVLDIALPERIAPRAGQSHADCLHLDQSGFDALNDELSWEHNSSLGPASLPHQGMNGHSKVITITNGDVKHHDANDTKPKDASLEKPAYACS